ncbi:hypothetical protein GINT2_001446 [Glugoides intestinalis]
MDSEKVLLERESAKHEENIKKVQIREALHRIKAEGYSKLEDQNVLLVKVFLGYLLELYPNNNELLIDSLIKAIKCGNEREKIVFILENRIKEEKKIIQLLS